MLQLLVENSIRQGVDARSVADVQASAVPRRRRIALGAERSNVMWMVLRETLWLIGIGVAIGLPAAYDLRAWCAAFCSA